VELASALAGSTTEPNVTRFERLHLRVSERAHETFSDARANIEIDVDRDPEELRRAINCWKPIGGQTPRRFTANELVADIHDRMPVVLAPNGYARWLGDEPDPRDLMRPFPADLMRMWPISTDRRWCVSPSKTAVAARSVRTGRRNDWVTAP
jgi:hypothetical protein